MDKKRLHCFVSVLCNVFISFQLQSNLVVRFLSMFLFVFLLCTYLIRQPQSVTCDPTLTTWVLLAMNGLISKPGGHLPCPKNQPRKMAACTQVTREVVKKNIIKAKVLVFLSTLTRQNRHFTALSVETRLRPHQNTTHPWSLQNLHVLRFFFETTLIKLLELLEDRRGCDWQMKGSWLLVGLSEARFLSEITAVLASFIHWGYGKSERSFKSSRAGTNHAN